MQCLLNALRGRLLKGKHIRRFAAVVCACEGRNFIGRSQGISVNGILEQNPDCTSLAVGGMLTAALSLVAHHAREGTGLSHWPAGGSPGTAAVAGRGGHTHFPPRSRRSLPEEFPGRRQ